MSQQQQTVFRVKTIGQGPSGLVKLVESIPSPRAHEVLVRVKAVSLNFRDVAILSNSYGGIPIKDDVVLGGDLAGEVVSVGEAVTEFKKGDRVVTLFDQQNLYGIQRNFKWNLGASIDGTLQEYRALPEVTLLPIPPHLSYEEASCLPIAGVTAWSALYGGGTPLLPGQSVLFQGTGGVSMLGFVLAQAAGATTIVTSSSDEKLEKLGATHTINYKKTPDWDRVVNELTNGVGVHQIFDNVGGKGLQRSFNCIAIGGTISAIGFLGANSPGDIPDVTLLAIMKGASIRGIRVGSKQLFEDLLRFMDTKKSRPIIDKIFPFEQTREALEYLESGQHFGKVVVQVSSE
ncbi:NAD-P-binding protein [Artomyces pyxidatus]|uniref:NAD-P-binding protein n=1 Tax=Artomyces pyxidatus TaxID=48021 RepID=A0ACB8TEI1_9AGAM|nr:NAD-P-binding protein [Artomyces pyxidatus]